MNLFNIPPQLYWDFTKKYTQEQKREEIINRIKSNNYIGSEKKDGHYNRTVKCNGELRMESRTVSVVTGEHNNKKDHVPHIAAALRFLPNDTVIIGELYYPGKTSQEVGKILQCLPPKAIARQEENGKLHYYIHDVWYLDGISYIERPYSERIKMVMKIKEMLSHVPADVSLIEYPTYCETPDSINELMEDVFARGGEGIVLVDKDSIVEPGKRTAWRTIKVKRELDHHIDCFFTGGVKMGAKEYTGKELATWIYWEDLKTGEKLSGEYYNEFTGGRAIMPVTKNYWLDYPGSLEIGVYDDDRIVPIGYLSGITDEMRENCKDYRMKCCEVTCMQFTEDGKLRHARLVRMRDDINPGECTMQKYWG